LLANAVYQPKSNAQTHRLRGQARSYTASVSAEISKSDPKSVLADIFKPDPKSASAHISKPDAKPVGAGLLANPVSQPKSIPQTHRLRGQARSCSGPLLNRGNAITPPAFRR
jgi:hypothetical protein